MELNFITTKEELLDLIKCSNFNYSVEYVDFEDSKFKVLNITILDGNNIHRMQPILLAKPEEISKISKSLWQKRQNRCLTQINSFSLKENVIKEYFFKKICFRSYENILDVGCHNTFITSDMVEQYFSSKYIGVDVNSNICVNSNLKSNFLGDVYQLPLADQSVDLVFCSMLLLNLVFPNDAIEEMIRVLKKQGTICIIDINSIYYKAIGYYKKINSEHFFIRVFETEKSFFTLKRLGRYNNFVHCYHHCNLYSYFLNQKGLDVVEDETFGVELDMFNIFTLNERERLIKSFARSFKHPQFKFLKAIKDHE